MNTGDAIKTPATDPAQAAWTTRAWTRVKRSMLYFAIRLFRVRDASERVARGFALGLSVNFFPTFGFGVLVSGFVARLLGGNVVAGVVGGASVMFFWPALFFLNVKVGAIFIAPPIPVENIGDVTERTINALVWGQTLMLGAVVNTLFFGLAVYFLLLAMHSRFRPLALKYFRGHASGYRKIPMR